MEGSKFDVVSKRPVAQFSHIVIAFVQDLCQDVCQDVCRESLPGENMANQ